MTPNNTDTTHPQESMTTLTSAFGSGRTNDAPTSRSTRRHGVLAAAVALALTGCAITPKPLTQEEQTLQLKTDRELMFDKQEPVTGAVTLEEAMARAIKYNLDNRLKLMEEAVAQRKLDLSQYDLLPRLTAAAGYTSRDSYAAASSMNVFTRTQSLVPSTSQERSRGNADLGFTWNVLDFGVSYYQAQQNADHTLIMQERRRKVVHSLMQQVRQAYWLALGAQQMEARIPPLVKEVGQALSDARRIEVERLRAPLESLAYRRQLLDTMRQLEAIRDELAQAKPRLASLMNLAPGRPYQLQAPSAMPVPRLPMSIEEMEEAALLNRPELVEARYNERIGVLETRKAIARMMPGLELSLGHHYDSNSFLVDNQWTDAGLRISWNLLNVLSGPKMKASAEAQLEVARTQRLALNMAVLSQVHVAYRDFLGRQRQFELASDLEEVDNGILVHTRNAARNDAQGRMSEIRAQVGALFSELRRYQSYGALQTAYGAMQATLGSDPLPAQIVAHDIKTLAKAIAANGEVQYTAESAATATSATK